MMHIKIYTTTVQTPSVLQRPASPRPGPLTSDSFLGHRLPSQTNTCIFCTLCPHSCAPGNNFPVGHLSPNCSGPSTINLGVLWRPASGKKLQLVGMSILLILLSPGLGCHMLTPLRDRRPRRSIPSQERPLLATSRTSSASSPCATSVRPVPTAHPRCPRTDPPRARLHVGGICAHTRPCSCPCTYTRTCP